MARYSKAKHREVARAIIRMDEIWTELFREIGLGDLSYCDLLINMWLRKEEALHKTDLYQFMPTVSQRTAIKYVQGLIDNGLLTETCDQNDKRVKQVALTDPLAARLESFYDLTCEAFYGKKAR